MASPLTLLLLSCVGAGPPPTWPAPVVAELPPEVPQTWACGADTDVLPGPLEAQGGCVPAPGEGPLELGLARSVEGTACLGPPAVADVDGDGSPEVVVVTRRGRLVVVDGATGEVQGSVDGLELTPSAGVVLGDVEGDGTWEVFVADVATSLQNGAVHRLTADGALVWSRSIDTVGVLQHVFPSLADLDADGVPEVVAGRAVVAADGALVGSGAYGAGASRLGDEGYGGAASLPVDLDGDGAWEVLAGNALYAADGTVLARTYGDDGIPAVADFDGDGRPEVAVASGGELRTYEHDLSPTGWSREFTATTLGPAAVDDLDGDGLPELVIGAEGAVRVLTWAGVERWSAALFPGDGPRGPVVADLEGDGWPEVVAADVDTVRVLDGLTGTVRATVPTGHRAGGFDVPVVADVDGDGLQDVLVCTDQDATGLQLLRGDTSPGRALWTGQAWQPDLVDDEGRWRDVRPWAGVNGLRTAAPQHRAGAVPDLAVAEVDRCLEDCPLRSTVTVVVENRGAATAPEGVRVEALAGGVVVHEATVLGPIPAGWRSTGLVLTVPAATDLAVRVVPVAGACMGQDLELAAPCL